MQIPATSAPFTPEGDTIRAVHLPGDGPLAVYLHGLGCHGAASWAGFAVLRGRPALLVDLPGHGRSDGPSAFSYTLPDLARAVASLLDAQAQQSFEVFGHSLGGSVAIHLADRRPDLVDRLVLVEPAMDPAPVRPGDIAATYEHELDHGGWERILEREAEWRRADVKLTAPIALVRCARGLSDAHAAETSTRLLRLPASVLLVTGEQRTYLDEPRFADHGIGSERLLGAGHFVMLDRPRELLARVDRPARG